MGTIKSAIRSLFCGAAGTKTPPLKRPGPEAKRTGFYIRVYPEGGRWICEEGDAYSDGTEVVKTKDAYPTEREADYARLMQLH